MPAPEPGAVVDRLKVTARDLLALVNGATPAQLVRAPAPGEWSPAGVVAHLADAELVYGYRLRMVVTGDRPYLAAYDEGAWADRLFPLEPGVKESLTRWRALRDANVRLLDALEPDEWKLTGLHQERGEVTVLRIAALMADHDRTHLDQIRQGLAT